MLFLGIFIEEREVFLFLKDSILVFFKSFYGIFFIRNLKKNKNGFEI